MLAIMEHTLLTK